MGYLAVQIRCSKGFINTLYFMLSRGGQWESEAETPWLFQTLKSLLRKMKTEGNYFRVQSSKDPTIVSKSLLQLFCFAFSEKQPTWLYKEWWSEYLTTGTGEVLTNKSAWILHNQNEHQLYIASISIYWWTPALKMSHCKRYWKYTMGLAGLRVPYSTKIEFILL